MSRKLDDWIEGYMRYVETNSESPTNFHRWAAVSAISAALQRKVYMRWGHTTIYPNQYIILVGPSALSRKAEPIQIISGFIRQIGMPVIGQDNSQESIIRDMKNSTTTFKDATSGDITFQCAVSAFIEELSVFTGYQNATLLAYLTDWYDSLDKWTRRTKHQGHDEILGMCFNMLSSTAPDWIPHILPMEAIGGGFTSRVLFVVEGETDKIIADPTRNPPDEQLKADLLYDLELIHSITGEIQFSKKAKDLYIDWYTAERKALKARTHKIKNPLLFGYVGRKPTHVKKLSMALCVSRARSRLVIESKDFLKAVSMLNEIEIRMPDVYKGLGKARYAGATDTVMDMIRARKVISRSDILRAMSNDIDSPTLEIVMRTLIEMRSVKAARSAGSSDLVYTYVKG